MAADDLLALINETLSGSSIDEDTRAYIAELLVGGEDEDWEETLAAFLSDESDAGVLERLVELKRGASLTPALPTGGKLRGNGQRPARTGAICACERSLLVTA